MTTPTPNSSTGGYLLPTSSYPAYDDALQDIFQAYVASVTGLPQSLVRPRWQASPPPQPAANVNWAALGVSIDDRIDNPTITHNATDNGGQGSSTLSRQEQLSVYVSFYGPNAQSFASLFRDGSYLNQNSEALNANAIRIVEVGSLSTAPVLINAQYINRVDVELICRRQVNWTYAILNILSVPISNTTNDGVTNSETIS